VDFLFVQKK